MCHHDSLNGSKSAKPPRRNPLWHARCDRFKPKQRRTLCRPRLSAGNQVAQGLQRARTGLGYRFTRPPRPRHSPATPAATPAAPLAAATVKAATPQLPAISMLFYSLLVSALTLAFLVACSKSSARSEEPGEGSGNGSGRRHPGEASSTSPRLRLATHPEQPCPPAPRPPGFEPRLQLVSGAIALLVQVVAIARWTQVSSRAQETRGLLNMGSVVVLEAVLLVVLPSAAPEFYSRHCQLLLGLTRLAYFSLPLLRDPDDVQSVLQGEPSGSRWFGGAADLFSLTLAARGLALLLGPLVCPLPLLPHLALAAFAVERCRTTPYMCAQPMLQHPTWRRRIRLAHRVMDGLLLLTVPKRDDGDDGWQQALDCRVFVTFYQLLLGVVLPTLVLASLQGFLLSAMVTPSRQTAVQDPCPVPQQLRAPGQEVGQAQQHPHHRQAQQQRNDQQQQEQQQGEAARVRRGGAGGGRSLRQRCWSSLRWLPDELEGGVRHMSEMLTCRAGPPLLAVTGWWALLTFCWVAAMLLEQPSWRQEAPTSALAGSCS
ncbi:hypothetical protein ACK3TF_004931 [Chlorella vulgaris]